MRRIFILLLCNLLTASLFARAINEEQARTKAAQFFQRAPQSRSISAPLQLVWNGESSSTRQNGDPAFYVFNRTDRPGFVIISGDDQTPTILGYSYQHSFRSEQMPLNLKLWMENLRQQILRVREGAFRASTRSGEEVGDVVLQLETAQWNQTEPYNNDCPIVNGKRAVTGCTATAFAIAMRYRRWPDQGVGTIPSYQSKGSAVVTVSARPLDKPYQWDLMPMSLTNSSSEESKAEVARLMADCGAMGQAMYGSSTAAYERTMLQGAIQYMKYYADALSWSRELFSDSEWIARLKKSLHDDGPIIYCGSTKNNEGHAFILDGYTSGDYFSVNWGWGGLANGFYLVDKLAPTYQGTGGSASMLPFDYHQTAILDFKKAEEGVVAKPYIVLHEGPASNGTTMDGLTTTTQRVEKGVEFDIKAGFFYNIGNVDFAGNVALALFDSKGEMLGVASQSIFSYADRPLEPEYLGYINKWTCQIDREPQVGDYIALLYQADADSEWIPMRYSKNVTGHLELRPASMVIAKGTSLKFDRKSRQLTLTTLADITWKLVEKSTGHTVASGKTSTGKTTFQVDASALTEASYDLVLEKYNSSKILSIKLK